ncbi:MAG: phosphonate ABC transporter ATP-binding protein [Eubacteriaceae bacterium]|nr:phosphonate ABC transporter ATP-binding protein [Eubacteriaceae bacterium]
MINSSIYSNDAILSVKGLKKYYGATKAVDDVDFDIKPGEIVSIIGRSGAGKSTVMRCINRLVLRDEGSITFEGMEITNKMSPKQLREARSRIGFIFQNYNLVYRLTVFQNVMHGRLGYMSTLDGVLGRYSEEDKMKAYNIIETLGLNEQLYQRAADLSGGQKQRVAIARALMQEPSLLMCDEPIASLDPVTSRTIMELIVSQARERGIACLINLHQVDFAKEYSTRIIGMRDGKLVFDGSSAILTDDMISYIYKGDDNRLGNQSVDMQISNKPVEEYNIV